jgi:hypothetical protein
MISDMSFTEACILPNPLFFAVPSCYLMSLIENIKLGVFVFEAAEHVFFKLKI